MALLGFVGIATGLGIGDPAVVTDIDDDGVFAQAFVIQVLEEGAAGFVEPLDHGPVFGDVLGGGFVDVFVEQALWRGVGIVRHHGRIPDEERLLRGLRLADEVKDGLHGFAADVEPGIAMASADGHSMGKAATREVLLPPLTCLQAEVTFGGEHLGEGASGFEVLTHDLAPLIEEWAGIKLARLHASGDGGIVAGDFMLMRITTRDDASEAGAAETAGNVATGEGEAFFSQLVQMWRLDVGMALEAVVAPQMIVGDDHDDVWRCLGSPAETEGEAKSDREEELAGAA